MTVAGSVPPEYVMAKPSVAGIRGLKIIPIPRSARYGVSLVNVREPLSINAANPLPGFASSRSTRPRRVYWLSVGNNVSFNQPITSYEALREYYALRESGRGDLLEIARAWRRYLQACEREMTKKQEAM